MKNFVIGLSCFVIALAGSQMVRANTSVVLSPERASHTGTLLNDGTVLIAAGVNESGDLNSALIYDEGTNTLTPTGNLIFAREFHAASKLQDGRVFISGGSLIDGTILVACELYDPSTGVFTQTFRAMKTPRKNHTSTLLNDGTVLLVGGKNAEIFDPATQTFTTIVSLPLNRSGHTATMLNDGTVLIAGGYVGGLSSETAEIYDPATQTFTLLANTMGIPRSNHSAVRLLDGRVLISGGFTGTSPQSECDLYDPVTQQFTATTELTYHRSNQVGILLPNGHVLLVGGTTLESGFLAINEVFDPATELWTVQPPMNENRSGCSANMLPDGNIFVAGGVTGSLTLQTAEMLDPATMEFTSLPNLNVPRNQHTDTLLPDGRVLLAGGSTDAVILASSEIFDPVTETFTPSDNFRLARKSHTATLLPDNDNILFAGGKTSAGGDTEHTELYNISAGTFSQGSDMITARSLHTATLLPNGLVLEAAGRHGGAPTAHAELYDPVTQIFTATGDLNLQRKRFRANLLPDGTVFLSGGATKSQDQQTDSGTPTCEIYDPATGTFAFTTEDMHFGRTEHESTLLPDGHVIVTGGILSPNQADLYDPTTQTFTLEGSFLEQRLRHVAILLSNPVWGTLTNKVLIIGGADIGNSAFGGLEQALASCELYDPDTGQFSFFGNMTEPRQNHTATMLNDGRIMIAGGVSAPSFSGTGELIATGVSPTPTPTPTPTPSPTPTPTPSPSPTASPSPSPTTSPTPSPSPSPSPSASPTPTPGPTPVELGNISTRMSVGTGDNVMIGGFIITGSVPKKVIVRAIGTSLLPSFPDALRDPYLEVHDDTGAIIASNDNWEDGDKLAVLASGVAPTDKKESALVLTLNPGNYTAIVSGVGGTTGIGLVEVYDLSATDPSKLANISTRGLVQTGDDVMILGTIILGDAPAKMIFRAIGPSLPVDGAMADPTLELHDQDGNLITSNDNWRSDQEAEIIASNVPPTNDLESAMVATLNPGEYTAIVRGANNTTGIALIEAYQLPGD